MADDSRLPSRKPYEIRERLFIFACDVVGVAQKLQTTGRVGAALSEQLASAAVSAAANAEEADDGSSRRDFIAKEKIALREVKETRVRLRVFRATNVLMSSEDRLIEESSQLVKILSTIIRNAGG
jgi:four helix bundle protein